MGLPLLLPLLNAGISLATTLFKGDGDKKDAIVSSLQRMFESGDISNLEAEVKRLAMMAESDKTQASTTLTSIQQGGGKWRDYLGTVCVVAVGYNFIGIPCVNLGINLANSFIEPPFIQNMVGLDMAEVFTLLLGMMGLGGIDMLRRN